MRKSIFTIALILVALAGKAQNLLFKATNTLEYDHKGVNIINTVQDSTTFLIDFGNGLLSEKSNGSRITTPFVLLERTDCIAKLQIGVGIEVHALLKKGMVYKVLVYNRNKITEFAK